MRVLRSKYLIYLVSSKVPQRVRVEEDKLYQLQRYEYSNVSKALHVDNAQTSDLIVMVLDATKKLEQKELLEKELEAVGIRLNREPP